MGTLFNAAATALFNQILAELDTGGKAGDIIHAATGDVFSIPYARTEPFIRWYNNDFDPAPIGTGNLSVDATPTQGWNGDIADMEYVMDAIDTLAANANSPMAAVADGAAYAFLTDMEALGMNYSFLLRDHTYTVSPGVTTVGSPRYSGP